MNNKIREFAEQAFHSANDGTITDIKIPAEFITKFAELIIAECINALDETDISHVRTTFDHQQYRTTSQYSIMSINNRFAE